MKLSNLLMSPQDLMSRQDFDDTQSHIRNEPELDHVYQAPINIY